MSKRLAPWACFVGSILILPVTSADEGGFKLSKLNPFASRSDEQVVPADGPPRERVASRVSPEQPAAKESTGFNWPSLPKPPWPTMSRGTPSDNSSAMDRDPRSMPNEPSTWQKFNTGTKEFFAKTKQTLMPWASDSDHQGARSSSSTKKRATRSSTRARSRSDKKPFFSSFWKSEEEEPPRTVSEVIGMPRVPY